MQFFLVSIKRPSISNRRAAGFSDPDGSMHESTKLSTIKCSDRATQLGFKQLEFDLVQLPAQLVNPRGERR
jgi:hypothetical protein